MVGPIAVGLILLGLMTWRVSLTSDWQTTFSEAQTSMQKGDFSHAEQRFAIVLREHPENAEAHHLRSQALSLLGRVPEAREELDKVIALGPPTPALYLERARLLVESNDLEGAVKEYTRALELAPMAEAYAGRALLR